VLKNGAYGGGDVENVWGGVEDTPVFLIEAHHNSRASQTFWRSMALSTLVYCSHTHALGNLQ
jgi:hypothetical protein